jgi:hypothetical protein
MGVNSKTGDELRALADAIAHVAEESKVRGMAGPIVRNCVDHLRAVARIHDLNIQAGVS